MTSKVAPLVEQAALRRDVLMQSLRNEPAGDAWCRKYTELADSIVKGIFDQVSKAEQTSIAAVAVGGYGRCELAPGSDIDITLIPLDEHEPALEEIVRSLYRMLIDAFGELKWPVGYAYRLPSDAPALDEKTRAGLLDARLVAGSSVALRAFQEAFDATFPTAEFLISRVGEREAMRGRWHDTPRVVEFHLRDGAGGLRDLQTAHWFDSVLSFGSPPNAEPARETLLLARNVMHLVTGRKEDRLLRTRRDEAAALIGTESDTLAADVMRAGEVLESIWTQYRERARRATFELAPGVFAEGGSCVVAADATLADAAAGVCNAVKLGIAVRPVSAGDDLGDAPRIVECVASGAAALRALDGAGLLSRLLPEYGACKHLLSRDSVHRYSVGEHTLRVVDALDRLRGAPEFETPWSEVANPRPLYLAALLHDLGKTVPEQEHSEAGAVIAADVCNRWRVGPVEKEQVVWLVRHHLSFAQVARTHDLARPETAAEMAVLCQRQDVLASLYLLTIADSSSVSAEVWTHQMAHSAEELYSRARSVIGIEAVPADPAIYRNEAMRRLKDHPEVTEELLGTMPTHYLLATPAELLPLHADLVARARQGETVVVFQNQPETATTDVTVCTKDLPRPGLLSRMLGVAYAFDLTLNSARVASTRGSEPVALDVLSVCYQGNPLPAGLSRFVAAELKRCLTSEDELITLLRKHGKDPSQTQLMLEHRFFEGEPGVLEIVTPRGRGMPYRVAKQLAKLGWRVHYARIGQWAGKAVARFYVDSATGPLTARQVDAALP